MLTRRICGFIIIVAICILGCNAAPTGARPAYAGQEDAALFQETLSAFGQWLNYGQYGQVWRPGQVDKNWRPYTNGRWVPTPEGYVFETDEPWGWATYHYGNWLPTKDHGWVWVPGRTWYPHTVNWRTNDENVGWAPVPPPESMGAETFYTDEYPTTDYSSIGLNSSGYNSNNVLPSNWIFTRATDFLLGWGQPYSSAYSYASSGVMLAPQYIPVIYERTVYVTNYVSPSYAANAYYNWGPPLTYITKVTTLKNIANDLHYKNLRLAQLRNVMPPPNLRQRHPAWREVLPMVGTARQGHLRSVPNFKMVSGRLNYPDAIPAPTSLNQQNPAARSSSPLGGKPPISGKPMVIDNTSLTNRQAGPGQLNKPENQSQVPSFPRTGTAASVSGQKRGQELLPKNLPAPTPTSPGQPVGQQLTVAPPHQPYQSRREVPRGEARAYQENQVRRYQEPHFPPDQQRAEQELRIRQQQRLLMEQRQREAAARQLREQQQSRSQQQLQEEQQRRQAEMQRQQQMQQQRQAEIMRQQQLQQQQQAETMRQQQLQQQRQAEMIRQQQMAQQQQHQAEMMRARQMQQQQQVVRQAPPPAPQAPPAQHQRKRDNQQQ